MMSLELAQALELAQLVELEARWENLRVFPVVNRGRSAQDDLAAVQRAYDSYHTRLVAYNRQHRPAHVPELLLNTAIRLGRWCEVMSDLFGRIESDTTVRCPVSLVEKAYRRAENIASRLHQAPPSRRTTPQTIQAAIEDVRIVASWCASLHQTSASA
jgi:hypothetical protein